MSDNINYQESFYKTQDLLLQSYKTIEKLKRSNNIYRNLIVELASIFRKEDNSISEKLLRTNKLCEEIVKGI